MSTSPFPPIGPFNLPLPILAHASTFVGLGLYLIFRAPSSTANFSIDQKTTSTSTSTPGTPSTKASLSNPLALPSGRGHEISTVLGLATVGLGLSYLLTSYVEVERNQFLYATVPARLILAGFGGLLLVLRGKGMSVEGRRELGGLVVYDVCSVLILGWWLGEGGFSGRARVW